MSTNEHMEWAMEYWENNPRPWNHHDQRVLVLFGKVQVHPVEFYETGAQHQEHPSSETGAPVASSD